MPNRTDSPSHPASLSRWLPAGVLLAAALSAITGIVSYRHGLDVARLTANTGMVAYLVPLVPDLMIATSSVTLIEAARHGKRPATAMAAFAAGFGWTVAQNIAGGWGGGVGGRLIAGGIPLALVMTFESLLWLLRNARRGVSPGTPAGDLNQDEPADPPAAEAVLLDLVNMGTRQAVADLLGVPKTRVQRWAKELPAVVHGGPEAGASDGGRDGDAALPVPAASAVLNGGRSHG